MRNSETGGVELLRVTLRECVSTTAGGAIYNAGVVEGDEVSIVNSGDDRQESVRGGGIANEGASASLSLRRCEIRGNRAAEGGGIFTVAAEQNQVTLDRCTLRENQARSLGGGIALNAQTHVTILNSTLSGNTAGMGGGLSNDGGGVFEIRNSTLFGNHAELGGGIMEVHFDPHFILVANSIIAGNTAEMGPNCSFRFQSLGATLLGDAAGCEMSPGDGDLLGIDPMLGELVDIPGSRGAVHVPAVGSPVVDSGDVALCTREDQRGKVRPADGDSNGVPRCDIGAVER